MLIALCASAVTSNLGAPVSAAEPDALAPGFMDPPNSAKPRVWWHWMSGNVSAEGAELDLEWMRRVGVGGVHVFSGDLPPAPSVIKPPKAFMSPGWQEVFRRSVDQAHAAGMEVAIAGSPGWSETGGPWVAPADGMKKYVWSETAIKGGRPFQGQLAAPPRVTGPFQANALKDAKGSAYGDAAVFAFPTPEREHPLPLAKWQSSAGAFAASAVTLEGLTGTPVKLARPPAAPDVWLEATFPRPTSIGAVTLSIADTANLLIQAEEAPGVFRTVAEGLIEAATTPGVHPAPQETVALPDVSARRFRFVFKPMVVDAGVGLSAMLPKPSTAAITIKMLRLTAGARLNGFEAKAGFEPSVQPDAVGSPPAPQGGVVQPAKVIDLTARLRPDGTLDWTPPRGRWTVVRLGWSLTGRLNSPAEPSASGLEVDKFDAAAVRRYLATYLEMYQQASGHRLGPAGVQMLLTDSWEAGVQNWTLAMMSEFRARRGYDPTPFLPVLTGRVVESSEASERFLFDFRQTLKDLVVANHHGVLAAELKARGMGYYSEAQGDNPRAIADGMTLKARADIPTAEYWYRPFATTAGQPALKADLEEAASVAHVYGKPFAAAEALTVAAPNDPWAFSPRMLKPVADEIFARGINRLLIHDSHHQPLVEAKPGLRLFTFGQYFNRNDTWAEQAAPWMTYLARSSYMLQQGRFVADVAYFYGEERNLTELFQHRFNTDVPKGYAYDYINPEALLTLLSVKDGRLVTPSGMSYRVLFMPDHVHRLSLPAMRKLRDLVVNGAVVVGRKPLGGLGLNDPDAEIRRIADELWGDGQTEGQTVGKGRVYASLPAALAGERIAADVAFEGSTPGAEILTSHRRTDDADIYFVSNQSDQPQSLQARFRVRGKAPEVWRAETGQAEAISYQQLPDATGAPLDLAPHDAVFVVLRKPTTLRSWTAPALDRRPLSTLRGPWKVTFQPGRGAPPAAIFERLTSWTESADPGVRFFSGVATYSVDLQASRDWLRAGRRIELDLGEVRELATVSLNGRRIATTWHAPYKVDVTSALKPGKNRLDIEVVNLWPNRLIGDKQPDAKPIAFAPLSPYRASSPLLPSGLLGPVRVFAVDARTAAPEALR
ncbi:glycosyl hydrolase [Phenylobacterium sp. LjRoot225]|uniref:glycosyl hydrolase n=1 Tax=Phenylobacterium sp. LjRoot225 TaxID=3342285 RepID=UPI003ED0B3CD